MDDYIAKTMRDLIKYITDRVEIDSNDCWNWTLFRDRQGYGYAHINRKRQASHRVSYTAFIGPIPEGYHVDHVCWNPACCNPNHLQVLTASDNCRRLRKALMTHCIHGHKFEGRNLIIRNSGSRVCRECMNTNARRYQQRKRLT